MLIKGTDLNEKQRKQVLAAYRIMYEAQPELTADAWMSKLAFHFTIDGDRLQRAFTFKYPVPVKEAK